ncbi:MAG: epimerase [Silvibacterium sp.]|nr:epimerase [Silvibacterium sp.]
MKAVIFGTSGMVGQGVLRECLLEAEITQVLSVVRSATGQSHAKLREVVHADFLDFSRIEGELTGYDACFFCLGVSSAGMTEEQYTRITYGITMAAATTLAKLNPEMTFEYISGTGTDSTEKGRSMWARVKGRTENALLALPFKAAYMFRPGFIQPLHGIKSKTRAYQIFYAVTTPLLPVLKAVFPQYVTTTERLGRAMIAVAKRGYPKKVLEMRDINSASESGNL